MFTILTTERRNVSLESLNMWSTVYAVECAQHNSLLSCLLLLKLNSHHEQPNPFVLSHLVDISYATYNSANIRSNRFILSEMFFNHVYLLFLYVPYIGAMISLCVYKIWIIIILYAWYSSITAGGFWDFMCQSLIGTFYLWLFIMARIGVATGDFEPTPVTWCPMCSKCYTALQTAIIFNDVTMDKHQSIKELLVWLFKTCSKYVKTTCRLVICFAEFKCLTQNL